MKIEWWKYVVGYENLYMVSNFGNVKSVDHYVKSRGGVRLVKGRIIKQTLAGGGYYCVSLCKDNVVKTHSVHRLVAQAFIPNPENKQCINHLNKDRTDNRIENLEWCTHKENNDWLDHNELISVKMTNNSKTSKPVLQFTLDGQFVAEYPSSMEAERQTGINHSNICQSCKGNKNYTHCGGFKWKFK